MVRIASRKQIGTKTGVPAGTTVSGIALGSGPSAGTTATANNVFIQPGPSINQMGGANTVSLGIASSSSSTNYKLSVASMLLAMKNQALGSLSLGGAKSGGSITENISGINLG